MGVLERVLSSRGEAASARNSAPKDHISDGHRPGAGDGVYGGDSDREADDIAV